MAKHLHIAVDNKPVTRTEKYSLPIHEFGNVDRQKLSVDYVIRRFEGDFPERDVVSIEYTGISPNKLRVTFLVTYKVVYE